MTSLTLKTEARIVGGTYVIDSHHSIRWSVGKAVVGRDRFEQMLREKAPLGSMVTFKFDKREILSVQSWESYPYLRKFVMRVEVLDPTTLVVRVLYNRFGSPTSGILVLLDATKDGKMVTVSHKLAEGFSLYTRAKNIVVYGKQKNDIIVKAEEVGRKIWW